MRATWLIVFVCTTAAADDGWRYQSRADGHRMTNDKIDVPPDPPLAAFTKAGTFYVMTVDASARPHCDALPSSLAIHSDGTHLTLGNNCAEWMNVSEAPDGVDVDGSHWYRDRGACQQAIAKHRPVATDLEGCIASPAVVPGAQSRATLDRVLSRGGTIYAIDDDDHCEPVRVANGEFHHYFATVGMDGEPGHGETTWGFHYRPGDDDMSITAGSTMTTNMGGYGTLCAHHQAIELGPDWVDLGSRYYFSASTCRAALARERERASWFAGPVSRGRRGLGFGGC